MRAWLALGVVFLLAGCASNAMLEPVSPQDLGPPWTTWSEPIATYGRGCGHCAGTSAEHAELYLTGLDAEGRVLVVEWAIGDAPGVHFVNASLASWRPILEALFASGDNYGQSGEYGQRVFNVYARQLSVADWSRIDPIVAETREHLRFLEPLELDCSDCGAEIVHANGLRVQLPLKDAEDSGWPLLALQMSYLHAWAPSAAGCCGISTP